jgi:hypothetical protein
LVPSRHRTQSNTKLRFFASNQIITETTRGLDRFDAHHCNTATRAYLTDRTIPLPVAEPIVNRPVAVALEEPP